MNTKIFCDIAELNQIKKFKIPIVLIVSENLFRKQMQKLNFSFKIMKYLAPGPFTFILPATNKVPKLLTTKQKTVGIRIPDNTFAREIVREFKSPIISITSIIIFGW